MSNVETHKALKVIICSAADLQDELTSAVEKIREYALPERHGILLTRHDPMTYAVAINAEVLRRDLGTLELVAPDGHRASGGYVLAETLRRRSRIGCQLNSPKEKR